MDVQRAAQAFGSGVHTGDAKVTGRHLRRVEAVAIVLDQQARPAVAVADPQSCLLGRGVFVLRWLHAKYASVVC